MNWYLTVLFLILGIALFLLEIFILPGFGIVGLMALAMQAYGVYSAYLLDADAGLYALLFCILADAVIVIIGVKQVVSGKYSVQKNSDGKLPSITEKTAITIGDVGLTSTPLRPNGKVDFGMDRIEVFSQNEFIESGVAVRVIHIKEDKIIVKSIT